MNIKCAAANRLKQVTDTFHLQGITSITDHLVSDSFKNELFL